MLRLALHVRWALAGATLTSVTTTLEGSGVAVTLNLDGFKQDLGAGQLGQTYYRLGQFSKLAGEPLVVSVVRATSSTSPS